MTLISLKFISNIHIYVCVVYTVVSPQGESCQRRQPYVTTYKVHMEDTNC